MAVSNPLPLDEFAAGTNVLVTGPIMTGKRRLMHTLLARDSPNERGTITITTRKNATRTIRDFERVAGPVDDGRLSIVDCVSRFHGFAAPRDSQHIQCISDPGDLTGIGIGVTEFMRRYYEEGNGARVGLHSLSTMLMYSELRRVFQFLHVMTGRISSSDFVGVFTLDDTVPDDSEVSILSQPFDALVELRETVEGTRELRTRGADIGPREWTAVEY